MRSDEKAMKIRITGSMGEVSRILEAIRAEQSSDIKSVGAPVESEGLFDRSSHGMEPTAYAVIVFSAHLAAALAHDLIRNIISKVARPGSKINIKED